MTTTTIALPTTTTLPAGYRYGAHAGGSRYYLVRESDDATITVERRDDLRHDDEPGELDTDAMTTDEIVEAIEAAFDA